jgi:hypothetical protein
MRHYSSETETEFYTIEILWKYNSFHMKMIWREYHITVVHMSIPRNKDMFKIPWLQKEKHICYLGLFSKKISILIKKPMLGNYSWSIPYIHLSLMYAL